MTKLSLILLTLLLTAPSWAMSWHKGDITQTAWHDHGGYQVEIDGTRYVFMRSAKILHQGTWHEVPDRMYLLRKGTQVQVQKQGFRIYALEIRSR